MLSFLPPEILMSESDWESETSESASFGYSAAVSTTARPPPPGPRLPPTTARPPAPSMPGSHGQNLPPPPTTPKPTAPPPVQHSGPTTPPPSLPGLAGLSSSTSPSPGIVASPRPTPSPIAGDIKSSARSIAVLPPPKPMGRAAAPLGTLVMSCRAFSLRIHCFLHRP